MNPRRRLILSGLFLQGPTAIPIRSRSGETLHTLKGHIGAKLTATTSANPGRVVDNAVKRPAAAARKA